MKICTKCGKPKSLGEFYKQSAIISGLRSVCKDCVKTYNTFAYKRNPEIFLRSSRAWRLSNRERICEYKKQYRKTHADQIHKTQCEWQKKNKSRIAALRPKRIAEFNKKNPFWKRNWQREQYKTNLQFRLGSTLRSRIRGALVNNRTSKAISTIDALGCSIPELKLHLEKQFTYRMSWANYGMGRGKWSIDHIMPCKSFDLTKIEEQRRCFNFTNLRPMWFVSNVRKGAKILKCYEARASISDN